MSVPTADFTRIDPKDWPQLVDLLNDALAQDVLPQTAAAVPLHSGETLYVIVNARWSELIQESDHREIVERLQEVASGILYVTDQRLIFLSSTKHASITYRTMVDVTVLNAAFRVELLGPHDPYFSTDPVDAVFLIEKMVVRAIQGLTKEARLAGVPARRRRTR